MNRRMVDVISVVLLFSIGFIVTGKIVYAADKRKDIVVQDRVEKKEIAPEKEVGTVDEDDDGEAARDIAIDEFDIQKKQKEARQLLAQGVEFCTKNSMPVICHAFTHTKTFLEGELYLFLLDTQGVVYAHGDREDLLWQSLWDYRDSFGALAIQSVINSATPTGAWVTYEWAGAVKVSFVQKIKINDKDFVIGCGYYPHSKKYAVIGLVKGAVSLFNQDVRSGYPIGDSFGAMGYAKSERFVFGDLYLYALDFNGVIRAQGDEPGLIGTNALEYKDSKGKAINKEIIQKLKQKDEGEGIWVEYYSKNALKYAYAEKVKDAKGNYYFIACGYYPEIDRDQTVDLVRRGYQFMKASGVSIAAKEFTSMPTFWLGDLYLFVYDMKGKCIAHGGNSSLVGQNQFDEKDQDGRYVVREMIEQAQAGGGWVDFKIRNSFEAVYVEKIEMGVDTFVIGSGMFPVTKPETMALLVKSAIGDLQANPEDQVFKKIVTRKGEFIRGDLFVYVVDLDGYCYAWGDTYEVIWKKIDGWKDDEGKPFIKNIIEGTVKGPDHFIYKFNKRTRVDYVERVEKNGKTYVIGSGFYK
ncbi:MAG TPA: cache domain-containing protein [Candidatus Babeliales bacterium]|nr:cache domain-containing protein [Candidatus Babeliales bacterium]